MVGFVLGCMGALAAPPGFARSGAGEACYSGVTNPTVGSRITWNVDNNTTTVRVTFSRNFVDNTYGTNSVGWGRRGHTFSQLVGSDHVVLQLLSGDGTLALQPKLDYISRDRSVPSGYRTLGVAGGDGAMLLGSASSIVSVRTSLSENFNTFGYVLTVNSPATNATYAPNPAYPNWIYEVWYEVTVKTSAFGPTGFGNATMTSVHASPSKTTSSTVTVTPTSCPTVSSPVPTVAVPVFGSMHATLLAVVGVLAAGFAVMRRRI